MARTQTRDDVVRGAAGTVTRPGPRPRTEPGAADPRGKGAGRAGSPQAGPAVVTVPRPGPRAGSRVPAPAAVAAPARPGRRPAPVAPGPVAPGPSAPGPSAPGPSAPWRVPPATRTTGPQPVVPQSRVSVSGGQPALLSPARPATRPAAPATPATPVTPATPGAQPRPQAGRRVSRQRMPFVLLLCGLLGGALVSALVISTTLAAGSFQITKLQNSTASLTRQRAVLQQQVAQARSPEVIEQKASKLGMRRYPELWFIDLRSGKTANDGPTFPGASSAPGYGAP